MQLQHYVATTLEALSIFDEASARTLRSSLIKQMEEVTAKINSLLKNHEEETNHGDLIWQNIQAGLRALEENDKKRTEKTRPQVAREKRLLKERIRKLNNILAHGNFTDEAKTVIRAIEEYQLQKQQESDEAPWRPADDHYFVAQLQKLKDGTQAWAMAYALRDLQEWEKVQRQRPRGLYRALEHVAVIKDVPDGLKHDSWAPEILLSSILSHELCINVIGEPFLVHPAFREFYKTVQFDGEDAHKWRSNTLRTIYSVMESGDEPLIQKLGGPMDVQLEAWIQERTEMFRNEVASLVKPYVTSLCWNDLFGLYLHAVEIGGLFWVQRNYLRVLKLSHLAEPPIVVRNETEDMVVHKYQNNGDPRAFAVPRTVDVVTHPLVLISGDGYGGSYEEAATLMPWEVWMKDIAPIPVRPPQPPYPSPFMSLAGRPITLQIRQAIPPQPHTGNPESEIRQQVPVHDAARKMHKEARNDPKPCYTCVVFMWIYIAILYGAHYRTQQKTDSLST